MYTKNVFKIIVKEKEDFRIRVGKLFIK